MKPKDQGVVYCCDIRMPGQGLKKAPISVQAWGLQGEGAFPQLDIEITSGLDGENIAAYTDRDFILRSIPEFLRDAWRIKLPNALKHSHVVEITTISNGYLYFGVDEYLCGYGVSSRSPIIETSKEVYVNAERSLKFDLQVTYMSPGDAVSFSPISDPNANMHLFFFVEAHQKN